MVVELTKTAGRLVQESVDSGYPEKNKELVQHSMYVTNQLLQRVQDGELSTAEMEESVSLIRRFIQVYSAYNERTAKGYRENLTDVLERLESSLLV